MPNVDTERLAELVSKKLECLTQLRDIGHDQCRRIAEGDMSQLLVVLSHKQRLLGVLQQIEGQLDPFRAERPDERRWRSSLDRSRCAAALAQCEALLAEIVQREKESERDLKRRRDDVAARLADAHIATGARGAYTQGAPSPRQIDLVSDPARQS